MGYRKSRFRKQIEIRLTDLQNQLIISRAMAKGYKSKSAFLRDTLLKEDLNTEQMIDEIHKRICKGR